MTETWRLDRGTISNLGIGTVVVVMPFGDEVRVLSPGGDVLARLPAADVTQKTSDTGRTLRLSSPHQGVEASLSKVGSEPDSVGAAAPVLAHEEVGSVAERAARIEVVTSFSRVAYFYALKKPTIEVNEERYRRPWGTAEFDVAPGHYTVAVSYPWALAPECGRNEVSFEIGAGEIKRVSYRPWPIRYLRGRIRVEAVAAAS